MAGKTIRVVLSILLCLAVLEASADDATPSSGGLENLWRTPLPGFSQVYGRVEHRHGLIMANSRASNTSLTLIYLSSGAVRWKDRPPGWHVRTDYLVDNVVVDDVIVIEGRDERGREAVAGMDFASGRLLWKRSLPSMQSAIAGEVFVVQHSDRVMTGLSPKTGKRLWEVRVSPGCDIKYLRGGRQLISESECEPSLLTLHSHDPDTGRTRWNIPLTVLEFHPDSAGATGSNWVTEDSIVGFSAPAGGLQAYNEAGKLVFDRPPGTACLGVRCFKGREGLGVVHYEDATGPVIEAFDPADGRTMWRVPSSGGTSDESWFLGEDRLYTFEPSPEPLIPWILRGIDIGGGDVRTFVTPFTSTASPQLVAVDGEVLAFLSDEEVIAFEAVRDGGALSPAPSSDWPAPCALLTGSELGRLFSPFRFTGVEQANPAKHGLPGGRRCVFQPSPVKDAPLVLVDIGWVAGTTAEAKTLMKSEDVPPSRPVTGVGDFATLREIAGSGERTLTVQVGRQVARIRADAAASRIIQLGRIVAARLRATT